MSVQAVVRKDFQDGIRSKLLWALMALFLLVNGGLAWLVTGNISADNQAELIIFLAGSAFLSIILLVPLTGLIVSIKSIVRERELGSIRILLSLPHTRGEVLVGKFVGRSGLLTAAILVGFVPAGLLYALRLDNFPMVEYLLLIFVLILFGIAFVAVGIGVSSMVKTETRATVAGFAVFLLLYAWTTIFNRINGRLELLSGTAEEFVQRAHLISVFGDMYWALLSLRYDNLASASDSADGELFGGAVETASQPFYLEPWFAFVILALWIAVPLAIGYARFERTDL